MKKEKKKKKENTSRNNVFTGKLITNKKGFGFVVMPNRAEAEKAIAANSEKEYMGRKMRVNEAKNTITE